MIFQIKHSLNNNKILFNTVILMVLSFLSKIAGLLRDRILTSNFGIGDILDSYQSAFKIPDLIFNILILGTLSSAFIPVFNRLLHKKDLCEAQDLVDDVLVIIFFIMGTISLIMYFGAPYLVRIVAISYEGEKLQNTIELMRIMAFSPLIFSLSSVFTSILNTYKKFISAALAPIFYNIGIIVGVLFFYPRFGVNGLGYGVILGALLHLVVQIPAFINTKFPLKFTFGFNFDNLYKLWSLYWPRILVIDISMISIFIGTSIASTQQNAVAVFNLAFNLNTIAIGIVVVAFVTAIFPYLTESYSNNRKREFRNYVNITIMRILFALIPITFLMLNYRAQLVRIVYGSGNFDWEATNLVYKTFTAFVISLPFQGLIPLFSRVLYARHDTKTPMYIGIFSIVLTIISSNILSSTYGVVGVAIAFSLSIFIVCLIYGYIIFKVTKNYYLNQIIEYSLKVLISSIIMIVPAYIIKTLYGSLINVDGLVNIFLQVIISSIPALIVYYYTVRRWNLIKPLELNKKIK